MQDMRAPPSKPPSKDEAAVVVVVVGVDEGLLRVGVQRVECVLVRQRLADLIQVDDAIVCFQTGY